MRQATAASWSGRLRLERRKAGRRRQNLDGHALPHRHWRDRHRSNASRSQPARSWRSGRPRRRHESARRLSGAGADSDPWRRSKSDGAQPSRLPPDQGVIRWPGERHEAARGCLKAKSPRRRSAGRPRCGDRRSQGGYCSRRSSGRWLSDAKKRSSTRAPRAGSWHIHQWPSPSRTATCAPARSAERRASASPPVR
jgi:hypothetical protein